MRSIAGMLKRILKILGTLLAATVVISMLNPLMVYHINRYESVNFGRYFEYSGVVNVQTAYSTRNANYSQLEKTCDSLGIHFAILSAINTVQPLRDNLDHRYGMTLIIPAVEIAATNGNERYLIIGDSIPLLPGNGVGLDSAADDAAAKGSIVILDQSPDTMLRTGAASDRRPHFAGTELYSVDRAWEQKLNVLNINKMLGAYLAYSMDSRSLNYILSNPERELSTFDKLNMSSRVFGIGALGVRSDINLGGRNPSQFPRYEDLFNLVHTVIVTRTPYNALYRHDRELTLKAIRRGNMFVAFSGLEPARGFLFTATSGDTEAVMGDSLRLRTDATINISLPDSNDVLTQIFRNGQVIGSYSDVGTMKMRINTPGIYRVQVFQRRALFPIFMKRLFPWIISNPIYVYVK
jgi:hypothetical protein